VLPRCRAALFACWPGAGDALVTSLREPARFFDALYRRFLRESAPNLHALCLRGMSRVFRKHYKVIGEFEDTEHIIYLLRQSTHQEVSDRLLELLEALAEEPRNAEKLINEECLQVCAWRGCACVWSRGDCFFQYALPRACHVGTL
jgi:hypothetical protein